MPRAQRVCAQHGCPTLTSTTYCPTHTRAPWSTHGAGKGRGRPWRRQRTSCFARDNYTCTWPGCTHRDPTGRSLEADHIGPTDALEHLRTLCTGHHRQRTLEQARAARTTPGG